MDINRVQAVRSLYESITEECMESMETEAFRLAVQLMNIEGMPMHGPVHHFLVPAVLMTVYCNLYKDKAFLAEMLPKLQSRSALVPGAFCANYGICGAALGIGECFSLITNNSPLSTDSWNKVMEITCKCGMEIARHGGPRCCKRDTFLALGMASRLGKEYFSLKIPATETFCTFFKNNIQCKKSECPYYPRNTK